MNYLERLYTQQTQDFSGSSRRQRRRSGTMKSFVWLAFGTAGVAAAFSSPNSFVFDNSNYVGSSGNHKINNNNAGKRNAFYHQSTRMSKQFRSTPSSTLDMICDSDQHEFELSVGHAMDVLRNDYPDILKKHPDFSIYDADLELIDPTGVKLHGLKNYRTSFQLVHAIISIFYCPEQSGLTFRMCYDKARQNIRIHWNAQVIPKAVFGGYKSTLHVDGISVYEISPVSGNITQHRIERLLIDDTPVTPEQGIFAALRGHAAKSDVDSIPVFNVDVPVVGDTNNPRVLKFHNFYPGSRSLLFNVDGGDDNVSVDRKQIMSDNSLSGGMENVSPMESSNMDWEALEKKNLARKKFGLKPLTPEEFEDLQKQVQQLDNQQQQRAAAAAAELQANKEKKEEGGFFKKLMGNVLEDTCESNYDCESPEVCCDFGFKKMCCSSGLRVLDGPPRSRYGEYAEVPVIANPGPNYPPPSNPRNQY